MSTFVLVHGAWHAAWAWERVVPPLEAAGYRVAAPDLPGHGDDATPLPEITLTAYAERVVRVLDALEGPAVLVGHSMGGTVISEVAERRPDQVDLLVYVSAYLLPDGTVEVTQQDAGSLVTQNLEVDEGRGVVRLSAVAMKNAFYGECSEEDAAVARLEPQAVAPFATPVHATEGNYGRVPGVYMTYLRDRAITPPVQRQMYEKTPCREVVSLDTDHSPFLSRPQELARHLVFFASAAATEPR